MMPARAHDRRAARHGTRNRLHVVQVARDRDLLRMARDAEPVRRQLDYAWELDRRVPGSMLTILVLGHRRASYGWRHENVRVLPLGSSVAGALRLVPTLQMLQRSAPISLITTQVPYDEAWVALAVARWHRIPVIAQIHSDLFAESAGESSRRSIRHVARDWVTRRTLRAFAAVRTVSSETRTSIASISGEMPLATIPVPVPMVSLPAANDVFTRKEPVVLFVGRLAPEKDLGLWLKVARAVAQECPHARFEIIGDGPERARLEREAELLGLGGAVSFVGFLPHDQLRERYARAAAVLLTSRAEGFGRVLVEAASQGTTAVATSLAGPRDIVINGVTGFLHEPGDAAGLSRSVAALVRSPRRAAEMGARAQTLVKARFDPDRLRAAWVDLWITTARNGMSR